MTDINPDELDIALRVLKEAGDLPQDHPQAVTLHHAVSKLFKTIKKNRRSIAKQKRRLADAQVLAATATANPRRTDDETAGLLIAPQGQKPIPLEVGAVATPHGFAGRLNKSHNCYICKQPYTLVDSFHHQLCRTAPAIIGSAANSA